MSFQLDKPSIIRNITTKPFDFSNSKFSKIIIDTDDGILKLIARGDCCSDSWFELMNDSNNDSNNCFNSLIDKEILEINTKISHIDMPESNVQVCDENELCEIILNDIKFMFILRNSSNGYYSGWVDFEFKENNKKIVRSKNAKHGRLTIIIGLPCSGKTTLMNNDFSNSIIHDDFFDKGKVEVIISELINGNNVCISDPRLCDFEQYDKLIERININKRYIQTILFGSDKDACIDNFIMSDKKDKRIIKDIVNLHKCYSIENAYINKFIVPVYKTT